MGKNDDLLDGEKNNEKNEPSEGNQTLSPGELKARQKLVKTEEKLERERDEKQKLIDELAALKAKQLTDQSPDQSTIESLKTQVELLSRQVISGAAGTKLKFREPTAADLVPEGEEITFTARNVLYVVASYRDYRGLERIPPHKLIVFQYAASDVRKDGREETVKNFCQYTTNLKTEIDYLRDHPMYGIVFAENTNEVMDEDVLDTQFKVRAATQLSVATPENIFARAQEYNIPNFRTKSAEQLRMLLVNAMAKQYKKDKKALDDEIVKRRALGSMVMNSKEE